ncbi:CD276 protein, partial [Atractosteus spatula]|nr:CD276 protein [Atractosteus spatula]
VSAAPVSVSVRFGGSVSLPCDGSAYRGAPVGSLSLLWQTPARRVWAFRQGRAAPGPGFENRTEVSRDGLLRGDFSLSLHRARLSDEDTYECFREEEDGSRTFLGDVRLTVVARRDNVTLQAGASLSVPLLTGEPVEVLFDPAGSGDWTSVCSVQSSTASCVPQYRDRVSVENQELRLQELRASDQGSYTVRDLQGNTISTAIVTVTVEGEQVYSRGTRGSHDCEF